MYTLDQVIDTVLELPLQQQEMLIDIIGKRHIENRRKEIARDARKSIASFHAGELKTQPVEQIIAELRKSLREPEEV